MGTTVRLIVADEATALACQEFLEDFDAALSRFRPESELSRLNAEPGRRGRGVGAAARRDLGGADGGGAHERARRPDAHARAGGQRLRPHAPRARAARSRGARDTRRRAGRRPARPRGRASRSPTTRSAARRACASTRAASARASPSTCSRCASTAARWAIDCGGDMRVSGAFEVEVRHPLTRRDDQDAARSRDQAVATSGHRPAAVARARRLAAPPHPRPRPRNDPRGPA